jgi:Mrp family chromosome partitioning ATPase/capsular polysaccharide biosynthesis protein
MGEAPRYATLRDYLRVLREQRLLIGVVAAVFAGAALWLAERQDPVYEAQASVQFIDQSQDYLLVGTPVGTQATPAIRASSEAATVGRTEVLADAARDLGTKEPLARLRGAISASPDLTTGLVLVKASWDEPQFAARLSTAVARSFAALEVQHTKARYRIAARDLRKTIRGLSSTKAGERYTRTLNIERLNRIETLERIARPASVAREAVAPASPVSPRPVRDALLGLLLGLTIGLLGAFVRDALDRRLRGAAEIRDELKMPVIGHLRADVLGRTLMSSNGRPALNEADFEAFRILRTNLDFLDVDSPLKTVVITSPLPEEGKSTVSVSLACAYAVAGKRVLLVECDLRRPTLAKRLGVNPQPGITDYLLGEAEPKEVVQTVQVTAAGTRAPSAEDDGSRSGRVPTIACIAAGRPSPRPAELLGSKRFNGFLGQVGEAYDIVLLDATPLLSVVDALELLPQVDGVIMCVRAQRTTRDQARAARAALAHFPERPTGVVVTGVRPGDEADYGYYSYAYHGH